MLSIVGLEMKEEDPNSRRTLIRNVSKFGLRLGVAASTVSLREACKPRIRSCECAF